MSERLAGPALAAEAPAAATHVVFHTAVLAYVDDALPAHTRRPAGRVDRPARDFDRLDA